MIKAFLKNFLLLSYMTLHKDRSSKIFYYHDIHNDNAYTNMSTPLDLFKKHFQILKNENFETVHEINTPTNQVMITFDDGYRGIYENFDFFVTNNIPITIFLITSRIGQKKYLSQNEIRELLDTGMVHIGSHTHSHTNLDSLTTNKRKEELLTSKKIIEDLFGIPTVSLCYPRGRFNEKVIHEAKEIGYTTQYSCLPGAFFDEPFICVKRRNFVQHVNTIGFIAWLYGGGNIFKKHYEKMHVRPSR